MSGDWGKKFETDFKKSFDGTDIFVYRIKTRVTQYKGDSEIADFLVYKLPILYVLELKSTKEKRLPFDMIRANQILGLLEASKIYGIEAGVLVQFRDPYSHWYVPISVIHDYAMSGAKSISIKDMPNINGVIEVPFTQKRVSVKLDVEVLLKKIIEKEEYANNLTSSSRD